MYTIDGIASLVSGLGTTADKRTSQFYSFCRLPWTAIEARYRSSWLARKVIDLPPSEMCRPKRQWQAENTDITTLEEAERKIGLWAKLEEALAYARMGGGLMVIGTRDVDMGQPLRPESVSRDGLTYLHVMCREDVSPGPFIRDPASPMYGCPSYFEVMGDNAMVRIDPSRVIVFKGRRVPRRGNNEWDAFWGDSEIDAIDDAIRNADTAQNGLASLIHEAKVDIWGIPDLTTAFQTAETEQALIKRFSMSNLLKSTHNAVIMDANDKWDTRELNLANVPDVMMAYIAIVAGAASMPATVLLGKSPDGMNATGDGDLQNWERTLDGWREGILRPALDKLDDVLIRSALGSRPDDVWWSFGPLEEASENDKLDTATKMATLVKTLIDGGMPDEPLLEAAANYLVEKEVLPGLDAAMAKLKKLLAEPVEPDMPDAQAGLTQGEGDDSGAA